MSNETCVHRDWLDDQHDDAPFPNGPLCGRPATFRSCMPTRDAPTCEAHKCRCARPIEDAARAAWSSWII